MPAVIYHTSLNEPLGSFILRGLRCVLFGAELQIKHTFCKLSAHGSIARCITGISRAVGFNAQELAFRSYLQNLIRSCTAMGRMFRRLFLMTWLWHGVCEDSSCIQTFQRYKPVTGGGVSVKMFGNVMNLLSMTHKKCLQD